MAIPGHVGPPDRNQDPHIGAGRLRKRDANDISSNNNSSSLDEISEPRETYNPRNEKFRDDFELNYESIIAMVSAACDDLTDPFVSHSGKNYGIKELLESAKAAKSLPAIKRLFLAVLGEQGTGKSALVNAVLTRNLLHSSGGRKAATAYATVILHKDGADNHAIRGDVTIEFLNGIELEKASKNKSRAGQRFIQVLIATLTTRISNPATAAREKSPIFIKTSQPNPDRRPQRPKNFLRLFRTPRRSRMRNDDSIEGSTSRSETLPNNVLSKLRNG